MNKEHMRVIDLFAGLGGIRIGFERQGAKCVYSSEWDKHAQLMYKENFGETPDGDITKIEPQNIPDHEILLAGFPCQPFSIMGDKKGFADTRGTLFFNIEMILKEKQPYAFLLENVRQLKSHDDGRTFKTILNNLTNLGYFTHSTVLNALDFGLPQKRERTFIVGFKENIHFRFPEPNGISPHLIDVLESDDVVEKSLFVSDRIRNNRFAKLKTKPPVPSIWHENKAGNISPLPYSCALRASASYNYLLVNGIRRLSPREFLRLQGYPDSYKIVVSYTQIRKLAGNSVAVPVIEAIAKKMVGAIAEQKPAEPGYEQTTLFEKRAVR